MPYAGEPGRYRSCDDGPFLGPDGGERGGGQSPAPAGKERHCRRIGTARMRGGRGACRDDGPQVRTERDRGAGPPSRTEGIARFRAAIGSGLSRRCDVLPHEAALSSATAIRCLTTSPIETMPISRPLSTTGMWRRKRRDVISSIIQCTVSRSTQVITSLVINLETVIEDRRTVRGKATPDIAFGDDASDPQMRIQTTAALFFSARTTNFLDFQDRQNRCYVTALVL